MVLSSLTHQSLQKKCWIKNTNLSSSFIFFFINFIIFIKFFYFFCYEIYGIGPIGITFSLQADGRAFKPAIKEIVSFNW